MSTATDPRKARLIDAAWEARSDEHEAQLRQLRLALEWASLHPCPVDADGVVGEYAGWGECSLVTDLAPAKPLAGDGAPLVDAQAPVELGAALGVPFMHSQQLMADALELAFRLPRLWTMLDEATLLTGPRVWQARAISRETHDLSLDAALHADRLITAVPDKVGLVDARRLVHEARLHADPDRAQAEEDEALAKRGVWLHRDNAAPATTEVVMTLDTPDAELFDQSLTRLATDLRDLGDADPLDVRRAKAVGVLADPQYALDLMSGRPHAAPSTGGTGSLDLLVHLTLADLTGETGVATVEGAGALSTRLLADWMARHHLAGGRVSVRSVVDLADARAVDAHDPPPLMREQVVLRDSHCVFPGCRRDSRRCDLDHIDPYLDREAGGPPGQTTPANLAPLCRRHHNAKTHHGWTYHRRDDGSYDWASLTGHRYTMVPASRAPLDSPAAPDRRA